MRDPRKIPSYRLADASRYIGVSAATLRSWFKGRGYPTKAGLRRSPAILHSDDPDLLSFLNVVQAHVLQGIRKRYHIPMHRVRDALEYLHGSFGDLEVLASAGFFHDTQHLLMKVEDRLISLSERGQTVSEEVLRQYLHRLKYGPDGLAIRLYPFLYKAHILYEPQHIMIDPSIAFGKPCLTRLGIKADVIADRFLSGERMESIAEDYGANVEEIEEAVRWNTLQAA